MKTPAPRYVRRPDGVSIACQVFGDAPIVQPERPPDVSPEEHERTNRQVAHLMREWDDNLDAPIGPAGGPARARDAPHDAGYRAAESSAERRTA